jgi:hypothetical protein
MVFRSIGNIQGVYKASETVSGLEGKGISPRMNSVLKTISDEAGVMDWRLLALRCYGKGVFVDRGKIQKSQIPAR